MELYMRFVSLSWSRFTD